MTGLRVEAVLSGRTTPSSRFRVLQHVDPLARLGIEVFARPPRISKYAAVPGGWEGRRLIEPVARQAMQGAKLAARLPVVARSWRADMTWLEREMLPGRCSLEPLLHRPILFDVDDAIWLLSPGHERAAEAVARRAACVVAGNDFLAEWFASRAPAVERVWTAVDTERFVPATRDDGPFVVGWTGSGSSIRFLAAVSGALRRFLKEAPDAKLVVVSDVFVPLPGIPPERLELVPWSPAVEADVIGRFDVGLMPLGSGNWAKGKCAFKMLQYLACGVPAVVSPVGMNAQVLAMAEVGLPAMGEDGWLDALVTLHRQRDLGVRLGANGRDLAERAFAVPVIAAQLATVMRRHR